ncbi:hypothetical protein ACUW54_000637 [Staphylococcus cohnii]
MKHKVMCLNDDFIRMINMIIYGKKAITILFNNK